MVAFQWDATCNIWTYDSKVMRFLRFQFKLGHAVSDSQCSKICPKLPKFAQRWNFEIPPKIKILVFFKNKKFLCVERALEHVPAVLIFNRRNFHMLFLLSRNGLCMWILAYPLAKVDFFSQCSTPLVDMRFWGHVPNLLRNNNMERHIPYLRFKMVFLAFKTLHFPLGRMG
jgi:hypothetical protein